MGFLTQLFERRALEYDPSWQRIISLGGGAETTAGVSVTPDSALSYTAVFACVRVLAEDTAALPLILYRRLPGRGKERASDHRLYGLLHDAPNPEMTSLEFRETLTGHLALWGNAYAEKEFDRAGRVVALWPLRPDRMQPRRQGGRLVYEYRLPDGQTREFDSVQIMHMRGLGANGIVGYSPIALHRNAVGLGLATEEFGARFFGNGARPSLVLVHPGQLSPEGQDNLRQSWNRKHEGLDKSHRVAVLEEGIKIEQIGIPPEDAQFLQTRRFQAVEIARIFRVPPHKIQDLERATFSNIEHQSIEYVTGTLAPWLVRWEQRINADLLTQEERRTLFAEHLVDGLLRGDTVSRYQAYMTGRQGGWLSVNDIRERENMNPVDGGDVYLSPLNMAPAEAGAGQESGGGGAGEQGRSGRWSVVSGGGRSVGQSGWESRAVEQRARSMAGKRQRLMETSRPAFDEAMGKVARRQAKEIGAAAERFVGGERSQGRRDAGGPGPDEQRDVWAFNDWLAEWGRGFEEWMTEALLPLYERYGEKAAALALEEIEGDEAAWDNEAHAAEYVAAFAAWHVARSQKKVGVALGEDDPAAAVDELVAGWDEDLGGYLAEREVVMASNATAEAVYQENGVEAMRWVAASLQPCEFCDGLDGVVMQIGQKFQPPGLPTFRQVAHPPAHRGCWCVVVAA